ncbi:MAG: hypothetical protein C4306_07465 [Thermoleophilia bacterium]
MAEDVGRLFDEYATRFARGERPDLRAYLDRAGEARDELARLVETWLCLAPPPEPDEDAIALAEAWLRGEAPLAALRARRGLRRAQVVEALIERFRLDPARRGKVERYYHEVEAGLRLPAQERLLSALADILGVPASLIPSLRPRPLRAQAAFFRAEEPPPDIPPVEESAPPDEVDLLFRERE